MGRILVVDDQRSMRATAALMLRSFGYEVDEAADGIEGKDLGTRGAYDVVITDLRMGECDGMEVLRSIKEAQPMTEVIVMTSYGTIESAVESMRMGASDYIQKPFSEEELIIKVVKAHESRQLRGQVQLFAEEFKQRYHLENIIGRSQAIRDVLSRVIKVAPTDATVLITGESGTGKELVARAIHANSKRANRPFVTVNCAAISETLLESELFGNARGAFTGAIAARKGLFEEADGGTFFFDEIAETTLAFQAKLLRAIQEGEIRRVGENKPIRVDVRVVAATNVDLAQAVTDRRFRQDLFYRLNVVRFMLRPLRERREDIPLLIDFFLAHHTRKMGRRARLGEGVMDRLLAYPFPGNVRELQNQVEQAVALCTNGVISADDIVPREMTPERPPNTTDQNGLRRGRSLTPMLADVERDAIKAALQACDGHRERAAKLLDISPSTLWRRMKILGIEFDRHKAESKEE